MASSTDALIKFNFQPNGTPTPPGYIADTGLGYDRQRGYGWITTDKETPSDVSQYMRDRDSTNYEPLDTLMLLQHPDAEATAWEYDLPNGDYWVTVGAGDNVFVGGKTVINVEGVELLNFKPNLTQPFALTTQRVTIEDGKLTLDGMGGSNSKINYLEIEPALDDAPSIAGISPNNGADNISPDVAINLDLTFSGAGNGIDSGSLNSDAIALVRTIDAVNVPGVANTTGGDDAIVFQPSVPLEADTQYTFSLRGATDLKGNTFQPFTSTFSTGAELEDSDINFQQTRLLSNVTISSLEISPDGDLLYGASLTGDIYRWNIEADGSLGDRQTFNFLSDRTVVGMVFDPNDPDILWISHNENIYETAVADNFTGKVSRLFLDDAAKV